MLSLLTIERIARYLPSLATGAFTTMVVSGIAIVLGFFGGIAIYVARFSGFTVLNKLAAVFVSFFRGTPMLVQLLMLFYLPSAMGVELNPYVAAIIALALNTSAYQSEILRSGFQAIPRGQIEAAQIMGLSPFQILGRIQVPQVIRMTLPSLVSETVDVIKGSAVISVIAVIDLLRVGRQLVGTTYRPLEVYLMMAVVYLVLTSVIQVAGRLLESRFSSTGHQS